MRIYYESADEYLKQSVFLNKFLADKYFYFWALKVNKIFNLHWFDYNDF